jgi:hypothetical protein
METACTIAPKITRRQAKRMSIFNLQMTDQVLNQNSRNAINRYGDNELALRLDKTILVVQRELTRRGV